MSRKKTQAEFEKEVYEIFRDSLEILGEYENNKQKILVKYKNCGHTDYKSPSKLLIGQGCSKCKNKAISKGKTKTLDGYKNDLLKNNITYIEVIGDYYGITQKIKVRNNKCGHEYEANAGNILAGSGCPVCHGMKDTKKFSEQIEEKYPNEYEVIGEYINNRTPILVKHKCGHEWEVIPKDLLRDIRCPKCIASKGELFIEKYLTERNIEHTPQYTIKECKDKNPLPFDFMININGEKRLIEFDGLQHFEKKESIYYNPTVSKHDEIKNNYCKNNGIKLLRIPYWWLRNDRIIKELDNFCSL